MPLEKGKSRKVFEHNLKTEMAAGKPQKQALAIAYAQKRRSDCAGSDKIHDYMDAVSRGDAEAIKRGVK